MAIRRRAVATKSFVVKVTEAEHNSLQDTARRLNISASKLIHDALKEAGYFR